jgi:hypothetical protein
MTGVGVWNERSVMFSGHPRWGVVWKPRPNEGGSNGIQVT